MHEQWMHGSFRRLAVLLVPLLFTLGCPPRDPNEGTTTGSPAGSSGGGASSNATSTIGSGATSLGSSGANSNTSDGASSGNTSSGLAVNDCAFVDPLLSVAHPGGYLSANETWGPTGGPIILANDFTISAGVTLTILPCTQVRIAASRYFYVAGTLLARGVDRQPIVFTTASETGQRFRAMVITAPGSAELAYVDISKGGDLPGQTSGASLEVVGDVVPISTPLRVDHVTIHDSAGYGIVLRKWAGFAPGSSDLTITNCGNEDLTHPFPLRMTLNAVHTLPTGTFTGNNEDLIQVISESPHYKIEVDEVFHQRGVPYHVGGNGAFGVIEVDGTNVLASLTLEAGVEVRFAGEGSNIGGLFIGNTGTTGATGKLVAVGTGAAPITLTAAGANPPPGTWEGVTFEGPLASDNRMDHVRIVAAGAHGGDQGFGCPPLPQPMGVGTDAALKLFSPPSSQFFVNSEIVDSSAYGVFQAFSGGAVDFLISNTFTRVALCKQVEPRDSNGACPSSPPCP